MKVKLVVAAGIVILGFLLLSNLGAAAADTPTPSPTPTPSCPPPSRAYVLIGDVSVDTIRLHHPRLPLSVDIDLMFLMERPALRAASEAQSDFEKAGYTVVRKNAATKQDVIDAVRDPCARALWIFAHGVELDDKTAFVEEILMTDGAISTKSENGTVVPSNSNLNQVTLHSCGQNLPGWKALFPGATFDAWSTSVWGMTVYNWQLFATYPEIDPNTGREIPDPGRGGPSWNLLAPGLTPLGPFRPIEPGKLVCDSGGLANDCLLRGPTKSLFGTQTFNFYASDTNDVQTALFGATVEDGCIISYTDEPAAAPTFEVTMTNDAIKRTLENPLEFPTLVDAGEVTLTANILSPSSEILFDGFFQVLFGPSDPIGGTVALRIQTRAESDSAYPWALTATTVSATIILAVGLWLVRRRWLR